MLDFTDFLVETSAPDSLDDTLQQLPGHMAVLGRGMPSGYARKGEYYVVRVFGHPGFFKFAMESQGYCKVIGETTDFRVK